MVSVGDHVDGHQEEHGDAEAERQPRPQGRPRPLVPAGERESGVVHSLHEHEVVDAHGQGIGRRSAFVEQPARRLCSRRMRRRVHALVMGAACVAAGALLVLPGAAPAGLGRGHSRSASSTCVPTEGVRFCEGSIATRVATFDGVPLDVNVTLPATASRNLPADRPAPRMGRPQERSGLVEGVGRGRLRGAQLHRARVRRLVRLRRPRARPIPPAAPAAGFTSATRATRRATPSTSPACWPIRASWPPRKIGVTGGSYGGGQSLDPRHAARPRAPAERQRTCRGAARRGSGWRSRPPSRSSRGPTSCTP